MAIESYKGVSSSDIAFTVTSMADEGFELLEITDRWRVERGEHLILLNSGEARTMVTERTIYNSESERSEVETITVLAGTFGHIEEDYDAPFTTIEIEGRCIRIVDISEADPKLLGYKRKLNGRGSRVLALAQNNIKQGLLNNGIIRGVLPLDGGNTTVLSAHNEDPDPSTRISVFFKLPEHGSDLGYVIAGSRYNDSRKVINRLGVSASRTNSKNPN